MLGLLHCLFAFSSPLNHGAYLARFIFFLYLFLYLYFLVHMVSYFCRLCNIMAPMCCPTYALQIHSTVWNRSSLVAPVNNMYFVLKIHMQFLYFFYSDQRVDKSEVVITSHSVFSTERDCETSYRKAKHGVVYRLDNYGVAPNRKPKRCRSC